MSKVTEQARGATDAIDRNARSYDAIPYTSKPFPQSRPNLLAGIARLFGLESVPLSQARVLELGCASGGNIIPLAAANPSGTYVGYDISPKQVEDANRRIAALGLENIEIRCGSLTEIGPQHGEFDFIISHGVFSWIPEEVQEDLLRVSAQNLSPLGIAYVSYNVLPGWRVWQSLRDAFLLMIPDGQSESARVAMARDLMAFMKDNCPDRSPYGEVLRGSFDRLKDFPDDYIAHEYLEDANLPSSFRDFLDRAHAHGLSYLGETDLWLMFPGNYGAHFAKEMLKRTASDIVSVEQMLDVMTGRTFRQTLLVHKDRQSSIKRRIDPASMEGLHLAPSNSLRLERKGDETHLLDEANRMMGTRSPVVAKAMERVLAAMPGTTSLDECAKGSTETERAQIAEALMRLTVTGMALPVAEPVRVGRFCNRPSASRLARGDAAAGLSETTSLRHDAVKVDPACLHLLPMIDGTRSQKELADLLVEAAIAGKLTFSEKGTAITDRKRLREVASETLPQLIRGLERTGLLVP